MGVSFHAASKGQTAEGDLHIIEKYFDLNPNIEAEKAFVHLRETLEEYCDVELDEWTYQDFDGPMCPYSFFMRWRKAIAKTEGIDLDKMWGFGPQNDYEASYRLYPDKTARSSEIEGLEKQWYDEICVQWEDVNSPLEALLSHSDCDGELTPEECKQIFDPLRKAVDILIENEAESPNDSMRRFSSEFVDLVKFCAEGDYYLLFR